MVSCVTVLKVAEAFASETNYTVWSDLSTNLTSLSIILQYSDFHDNFKAFIRSLYSTIMANVGWDIKENEGSVVQCNFSYLMMLLCYSFRISVYEMRVEIEDLMPKL